MRSIHGGSSSPWSEACAALDTLAGQDVTTWTDQQAHDGLQDLLPAVNQLTAVVSQLVGSFDTRGLSETDGLRATRTWLTAFGRMSQGAASGWLSRARLLRQLPAVASAASAGVVSAEHLRPIADLVTQVGVDPVRAVDPVLAELAATTHPGDIGKACERIRAHVDPDGPDPDPDAAQRRGLSIAKVGSLFSVKGQLDAEGGAIALTALDALMRPPTPDDTRTAAQRRADAFVELARQALNGGTLPTVGGVRPQLGILLTPDALLRGCPTHPTDPGPAAESTPDTHDRLPVPPSPTLSPHRTPAARRATRTRRSGNRTRRCGDHRPTRWNSPASPNDPAPPPPAGGPNSPPPSSNASPATATSGGPSSTPPPGYPSTSAAPTDSSPTGCAKPSSPATKAVAGPAATPPTNGPTPTTSHPGTTAASPESKTSCSSADSTTASSTKDTGNSTSTAPPATSPSPDPTAPPTNSDPATPGETKTPRPRSDPEPGGTPDEAGTGGRTQGSRRAAGAPRPTAVVG